MCDTAGDDYPEICVRWDNRQNKPQVNTHFDFDFTDPNAPSVVLRIGEDELGVLEWRVWCHFSPGNPWDIGSITTPGAYNYSVKILNYVDYAGARNLQSAVLLPTDDHQSSIVASAAGWPSYITGDLAEDVIVVADSNGNGGALHLSIGGDVPAGRSIVAQRAEWLSIGFGAAPDGILAGDLTLYDGIPAGGVVKLGLLSGTIDLNGSDVAGLLSISDGGSGSIMNGGRIIPTTGDDGVNLSTREEAVFSGTANFKSLEQNGWALTATGLSGTLHFSEDVWGGIAITSMQGVSRLLIDGSLRTPENDPQLLVLVGSIDDECALCVDSDGWDDGHDWDTDATVQIGSATFWGNSPGGPPFVRETTSCVCDINNNGTVNPFDIDGFVAALTSPESYEAKYPGLEGSMTYHGDADCNGTFNQFDIQPFLDRVADGCCTCGGCGFMMAGGSGGPGGYSAIEAAALFKTYVDPARLDGWKTTLGNLAGMYTGAQGAYWADVLKYMQAGE